MLSRTRRDASDDTAVQPFAQSQMQKSMWNELEKRRHDWETEMHRIQEDFFQVSVCIFVPLSVDCVKPNTHRRRRRDKTVSSRRRRRCEHTRRQW